MSLIELSKSGSNPEVITPPELKVLSLNTLHNGRKAGLLDKILDFIAQEEPGVVLLQEVFEDGLERFNNALGGRFLFSQVARVSLMDRTEDAEPWGIAIGSKYPMLDSKEDYYFGSKETAESLYQSHDGRTPAAVLLKLGLEVGSYRFNFGTTHFPYVQGAEPSQEQLEAFRSLISIFDRDPNLDIVLTGDFNSPRGYVIFDSLARRFKDNILEGVTTTLDSSVRPEITWEHVVDGFFTSQHYLAEDIRLVRGLSDHKGILGWVGRVSP